LELARVCLALQGCKIYDQGVDLSHDSKEELTVNILKASSED